MKYTQNLPEKETEEAATDLLRPGDFRDITYILAKETSRTRDEIEHEFLNAPRISENSVTGKLAREEKENRENEKTKSLSGRREKDSLNNSDVKSVISKSLKTNVDNSAPQEVKSLQERNNDGQTNNDSNTDNTFSAAKEEHIAKENWSLFRRTDVITKSAQSADSEAEKNQSPESSANQENNTREHEEDYLTEAANYGLQAMRNLYYVQEPKLYSMGKTNESKLFPLCARIISSAMQFY